MLLLLWSDRLFVGTFRPGSRGRRLSRRFPTVGGDGGDLLAFCSCAWHPWRLAPLGAPIPPRCAKPIKTLVGGASYLAAPLLALRLCLDCPAPGACLRRAVLRGRAHHEDPDRGPSDLAGPAGVVGAVPGRRPGTQSFGSCARPSQSFVNLVLRRCAGACLGMLGAAAAPAVCQIGLYGGGCFGPSARGSGYGPSAGGKSSLFSRVAWHWRSACPC